MKIPTPAPNNEEMAASIRAQAVVRAKLGLPVMALMALSLWIWGSPHGTAGLQAAVVVAVLHIAYLATILRLSTRPGPFEAKRAVVITAILDPVLLSGWLAILGDAGALFVCFYLFTILGFGFRIGTWAMWLCQTVAIAGYIAVVTVSPAWREHPLFAASNLLLLVIVPMYATILIKKLRDARALAESESRAKTQLLANVSHELRTPLAGIMASAQLLRDELREHVAAGRALTILSLSDKLMMEINDLLDSSKIESSSFMLERAAFDLDAVATHLHNALGAAARAKGLEFVVDADRTDDMLLGDVHYLCRVMTNIAGNAVKFTDTGLVGVQMRVVESRQDAYLIRFSTRDTGIGIPAELHEKIFEPFVQASSGTTRKYGGTGLGMSLASDVVKRMGGKIHLESEVGNGSHFYFDLTFPRTPRTAAPAAAQPRIVYGKRLLVADDNETNLQLFKELLERDGHQVFTAKSGRDAVQLLTSMVFDVIYLDHNMQDMSGAAVLQLYRFGTTDPAPAYFLTADTTERTAATLTGIGAVGVLHKPITSAALRESIAALFPDGAATTLASRQDTIPRFDGEGHSLAVRSQAIADIDRHCDGLRAAISTLDLAKVRDLAHALKCVCDSVGARPLSAVAMELMSTDGQTLKASGAGLNDRLADAQSLCCASLRQTLTEA